MAAILNDLLLALLLVFSRPHGMLAFALGSALIWTIASWLRNLSLLGLIFTQPSWTLGERATFFFSGWATPFLNAPTLTVVFLIATTILAGVQTVFVLHLIWGKVAATQAAGKGIVGTLLALLGVGCSACGSVILTSILGTGAAAGLLAFLPLGGSEFAILGALILLALVLHTARQIAHPTMCSLPKRHG